VTSDVIRNFNRGTVLLATGVLGTVIFAALVLAVQEHQSKATQAERDPLLNADAAPATSVVAKSSNSDGKMTPGQGSSVDHPLTETSLQEKTEPGASTPVLALTPEINRDDTQAHFGSGTLAHLQDSAGPIRPKARYARNRPSVGSEYVGVKRRLIELWHESLAKSAKSRSWTAFSNLNTGRSKKAAYTAETNH
jgi:hypothetical protein